MFVYSLIKIYDPGDPSLALGMTWELTRKADTFFVDN